MLKLFGAAQPAHPLADPKEVGRLIAELPAGDATKALEELSGWHESVSVAEGFTPEARIQALFALDEAAQPRLRKLSRDYLAAARPSRFQENRMWTHVHEYWRQAGIAYAKAVDSVHQGAKGAEAAKPLLPLLVVRNLRAFSQQVKWLHFRYGTIEPALWRVMNGVYAFAESRGIADARTPVYPGIQGESTPRHEYVRALMLHVSSPDGLLPAEMEATERLIADLASGFELSAAQGAASSHWTDLAEGMAPQRLARQPAPRPSVRYLSAAGAVRSLEDLLRRVETTLHLPQGLIELGDPDLARELVQHLLLHWSSVAPERKHARHAVKSRLSIVHGFDAVLRVLASPPSQEPGENGSENWIVENVSAGGFGAVVPQAKGDWLKIGELLAMQPDGGNNWVVGVVRRVNRLSAQATRVGIQTLSRAPEAGRFSLRGAVEPGVLLPSLGLGLGETSIALRAGVFSPGQSLESERGGRAYMYLAQAVAERGDDYDIVRFREMVRES